MSSNETTQIPRTSPIRKPEGRQSVALAIATSLIALSGAIGCATAPMPSPNAALEAATKPTDRTYATVPAAAQAALEAIHRMPYGRDRQAMLAGAIVETEGGYTWKLPSRSSEERRSMVRLRVDAHQVATFVAHPRTGNGNVDRANEHVTRAERRLVDQFDPAHRPIFVLTPKGRILAYRHESEVVEIADLRHPRRTPDASTESQVAGFAR
jgi:hypothetical protein